MLKLVWCSEYVGNTFVISCNCKMNSRLHYNNIHKYYFIYVYVLDIQEN